MKHRTVPLEGLTLERLIAEGARSGAVFLTKKGKVRHVLMRADDGDQEVCALRNNTQFMAYLEECTKRALAGPRHTLADVKARFDIGTEAVGPSTVMDRNGARKRRAKR
jgi:hypothetical protein